ncbi:MAG: exo-alpha-sialidase, partial [Bacteroidetes bacterium]|nr:exo-alpha-sialidase [Bacteroidota bacterium]
MKKIFFIILIASFFLSHQTLRSQEKVTLPNKYQVDTRIDNMGYWRKMAEAGLVPVQPYSKPPAAKFTGSKIIAKGIMIDDSPDVPVTAEPSTQSENSIAVDPENMEKLLNSNNSTQYPSSGNLYGADYLTSSDEGETWGGSVQGAGGPNSGDPAACIDLDGRYFIGFIDNASGQSVAYSDNQGSTWTVVKVANGSMFNMCDKNHLWVDNSPSSPYKGNLYNGWMKSEQIEISYSNTHGTSWSTAVAVSQGTSAGSHNQGVNFKTGPNGDAYAVWSVYDSWPGDEKAIGFSKSTDGGATWSPAVRIINNIRGIRTTEVTQNMRCNSFPSMAVDLSGGPYNGHIYVVWANIGVPGINTGSDVDVYLIKSTDVGTTWSTPLRINQDPSGLGKQHYFPWIACDDSNGMLSIVFYDNRNVSATECEAFMAYSGDGGATWEDMKVSDVSFTPSPIPYLATGYFGDYLGITALGGKAYPCWTDNRSGHAMTYVSPIELIPPLNRDVIVYEDHGLNDATYGNGNGKMDFGETELLDLKLKNVGDIPGDSVWVTLSTRSHYITFSDSTEYYGYFDVGSIKMIEDAFL